MNDQPIFPLWLATWIRRERVISETITLQQYRLPVEISS